MKNIEDLKPIPKYILEKIKKVDKKYYPTPNGHNRFYKYYTKIKGELNEITVAVRNKYKKWYCKQVVVHGINSDKAWIKDIDIIMSYICVGWYEQGLSKDIGYYDYDWSTVEDKYFKMESATTINKEYILTIPKFKYSAINKYPYSDVMTYLRLYEKHPKCELLVKCGLSEIATSKQIIKKCEKDKNFCKWLLKNKDYIYKNRYYISSLLTAYKKNKSIKDVYDKDYLMRYYIKTNQYDSVIEILGKTEKDNLINYLCNKGISIYNYYDYIKACSYIHLDLTQDKNKYPHEFQKWHDIRIDEMQTKKAEEDEIKRKELYEQFASVSEKYQALERHLQDNFVTIIAKSPKDLIAEGKALNHCVGRMNYDQKFAREETLIFFIRTKEKPDIPLVTLEYGIKNHKILQCYAEHDTKPCDEILNYVNKIWLPYANRKIKKVA